MTPAEQAQRIAEIVEAALECEPSALASFLDHSCGGDATLRAEVESLLGYQKEATDFIEAPAYQDSADVLAAESGELKQGDLLREYKILSLIGEGGMGEVYLAEDSKLRRKVAIKLVKAGFGHASLLRHFQREERILAALTHPNIARLYGGAVTSDGIPYFVMEYVEGERLDSYCDAHQLKLRERLELFRKICSAVSYAHQHLVIHRDLKPANVHVTGEGEPKLLDFGIAKLLDDETPVADQTITLTGVMTPDYASPEQVRGEPMTTASDVYSLGVVLYELLTGKKPYRTKSRRPDEISRAVAQQEPARPSMAIAKAAGNSKTQNPNPKLLRGDLDNIVLMALRKEPARRYASVGQLSEDIRRHLDGLPISARRDTVGYRTSKFIARHRLAVAATSLLVIAILASLLVALWQARNASRQRDVAQRERSKTQRINTFLQDMLGSAAPEAKGVDIKVADVLGDASRRAKAEIGDQPEVMADVLVTLGRTYLSLGLYEPGATNLRTALEASLRANGELHPTTANAMGWLGLALVFQDKAAEGEHVSRKAVALQRTLHPEGNADLGVALYSLGMNLIAKGEAKAAEPLLEEAVKLIQKHLGDNHGYYLASLTALALARERLGNVEGAEMLYRRALEVGRGVEPRYRIFLAQASGYLGVLLTDKGAYSEAEDILRHSETMYREILGDSNSSVPVFQANLGRLYFLKGEYAKAAIEYRKALEVLPQFFPREHLFMVSTSAALGLTLTRLDKGAEGEPYLREALTIRRKVLPLDNYMVPSTESALGECLTAQKCYAEAEPLLTDGYTGLIWKLGEKDARTVEARQRVAKLYDDWGKPDQALLFR